MRVLLVLPDFSVTQRELRRCREALKLELSQDHVYLAAREADMGLAADHGEPVELYKASRVVAASARFAFIERAPGGAYELQQLSQVPVYRFDFSMPYGRARLLSVYSEDNQRNPQLSAHVFNCLAP